MNYLRRNRVLASLLLAVLLAGCAKDQIVDALVTTYYGYGRQFHRAGCSLIQNIENNALSKFSSRDDAIKAGLSPCSVCNP